MLTVQFTYCSVCVQIFFYFIEVNYYSIIFFVGLLFQKTHQFLPDTIFQHGVQKGDNRQNASSCEKYPKIWSRKKGRQVI